MNSVTIPLPTKAPSTLDGRLDAARGIPGYMIRRYALLACAAPWLAVAWWLA